MRPRSGTRCVCWSASNCWLVQTEDHAGREALFSADYAYFSSFSSSWLRHAQAYVQAMQQRFGLGPQSLRGGGGGQRRLPAAVRAAGGHSLLWHRAHRQHGAGGACQGHRDRRALLRRRAGARAGGAGAAGRPDGGQQRAGPRAGHQRLRGRFRHPAQARRAWPPSSFRTCCAWCSECQFDTIYHEHFSYLSLTAVQRIFAANGLQVFDVEELPTHGGSLRVFAQRSDSGRTARRRRPWPTCWRRERRPA